MSFNLGISNYPGGFLGGGLGSVGLYLYENVYYRKWITEIALAFYEGRQDEFVWLDLVKQFRNPEKQQILPLNFTREIIDEISILYREAPIYKIVDSESGKLLPEDQKLWDKIQKESRYFAIMDKVDRWCHLLGTVLVKVSFVDKKGEMVEVTEEGKVQLDILHGGAYDVKYVDSPYFISELLIGFGQGFNGFNLGAGPIGMPRNNPGLTNDQLSVHGTVTQIYWSPEDHYVKESQGDKENMKYEGPNPYGQVPAVPFFNSEPAHYYFLPVNEPLLYANHALNMRITDLNHIAKFQSFGVPVLTGLERGTSIRRGRPVDDFNVFRAGSGTRTGVGAMTRLGTGVSYRNFDNRMGFFSDGNADANANGMSIGPDTAIAVGEKGDFKFASPNADIQGLAKTIQQIQDWVRVNHGLSPKGNAENKQQESGFSKMVSKIGVLEENIRRQKLFLEREQQLFDVIKNLWNVHYSESGQKQFSTNATLQITYVEPQFPIDPLTKVNLIEGQRKIIETGDKRAIKVLFKHLSDEQIDEVIAKHHRDRLAQTKRELEILVLQAETMEEHGIIENDVKNGMKSSTVKAEGADKSVSKQDNKFKQSEDSSKQKGKNLDTRKQPKEEKAAKPQGKAKKDK